MTLVLLLPGLARATSVWRHTNGALAHRHVECHVPRGETRAQTRTQLSDEGVRGWIASASPKFPADTTHPT